MTRSATVGGSNSIQGIHTRWRLQAALTFAVPVGGLGCAAAGRQQSDCALLAGTGEDARVESQHSDMKRRLVLFALMVLVVALVAGTAFA